MSSFIKLHSAKDLLQFVDPQAERSEARVAFQRGAHEIETKFAAAKRPSDCLIVWLNASINRQAKAVPAFTGKFPRFRASAHQIALADPTLNRYPDLRHTWYIGDHAHDLQSELAEFLEEVAAGLSLRRIVLVGGSAGGFGALALSRLVRKSCAVALQPQTRIEKHAYYKAYTGTCWPDNSFAQGSQGRMTDLCEAYAQGFDNAFVYVQSMADKLHFWNHCVPFMNAIADKGQDRSVFQVDFWGEVGHAQIPVDVTTAWILAAVQAKKLNTNDLLQAYERLRSASSVRRLATGAGAAGAAGSVVGNVMNDGLVAASNMVRDHLLGNSGRMAP
jgi:pimeloyl-ACP methyl ester carboxylesterase